MSLNKSIDYAGACLKKKKGKRKKVKSLSYFKLVSKC